MKSIYKSLGEYIRQVKLRNSDSNLVEPMGINISKFFMPSVANTNGTDLSKYRVVKNGQFAYNPMHVGRDEVLPIALLKGKNKIIVSPAYVVFEIIDEEVLNPEYLMMWFRRKDFDRNAWFTTDNSVRGGFSWESLCEMELPIPSPEKQQEIVNEYNTVVNRIKLNEELNRKLEDTAQTLYKHWFVDFEFPISKDYSESIGKPELEGKPYKSNGGEMVYNELYDGEIPKEWDCSEYNGMLNFQTGKLNSNAAKENGKYPFFTCSSETFKTNTFSFDCEAVLLAGNNASAVYPLKYFQGKFDVYQRTYVITSNNSSISIPQIYFSLKNELEGFKGSSSGTATKFLTMKILSELLILIPDVATEKKFGCYVKEMFKGMITHNSLNEQLEKFRNFLLAKQSMSEVDAYEIH